MKHTPGPWRCGRERFRQINIYGADGYDVCAINTEEIPGAPFTPEIERANARLIAAAPELLEALIALNSSLDGRAVGKETAEAMHLANKAIAKAEGE